MPLSTVLETMETLDRIFQVMFDRYRRGVGVASSTLDSSWRRATNKVSGYLILPIASTIAALILAVCWWTGADLIKHKQMAQLVVGLAVAIVGYLLDRRFRKYLSVPPPLSSFEALSDKHLLLRFRIISVSIFISTCAILFLLHKVGVDLIHKPLNP